MFLEGIKESKKNALDIANSTYKVIKYNVDMFDSNFSGKTQTQITQSVRDICKGVLSASKIGEYNLALTKLTIEFGFLSDAFYIKRPFRLREFTSTAFQIHKFIRDALEIRWNSESEEVQTSDCLSLAEAIFGYIRLINKWGIIDKNFKNWEKPILNRFLFCLFEKSKELMVTILTEIQTSHYISDGKILSTSLDGFESHLSFVVGHYQKIPILFFGMQICIYAGVISSMFFMKMCEILEKEKIKKEFCMVILNSNLFKAIRSAQKSIVNLTKNQTSIENVKVLMNDNYLLYIFKKIHSSAITSLKKCLVEEFIRTELLKVKIFWDFDSKKFMEILVEKIKKVFDLLMNDFIFKDILYYVLNMLVVEYILLIVRNSNVFKSHESKKMVDRIEEDCQHFSRYCTKESVVDCEKIKMRIDTLNKYIRTTNIDETIALFVKIQIFYRKKIKNDELLELIKVKSFFNGEIQGYIYKYVVKDRSFTPLRLTQETILKNKTRMRSVSWYLLLAWSKFS